MSDRVKEYRMKLLHETANAWRVEIEGEYYWLPKSQCEVSIPRGGSREGWVEIPEWLIIEKGIA